MHVDATIVRKKNVVFIVKEVLMFGLWKDEGSMM
jgi:hypothetical protein